MAYILLVWVSHPSPDVDIANDSMAKEDLGVKDPADEDIGGQQKQLVWQQQPLKFLRGAGNEW